MVYSIYHFTKLAFGLLKRPRASGINTKPAHMPFFYSVAILAFIAQKLSLFHNKFLNIQKTNYGNEN
jgi:hypothetical protein